VGCSVSGPGILVKIDGSLTGTVGATAMATFPDSARADVVVPDAALMFSRVEWISTPRAGLFAASIA
jgi:hypothetical protein